MTSLSTFLFNTQRLEVLNRFSFLFSIASMTREMFLEEGKLDLADVVKNGVIDEVAPNSTISLEATLSWVTRNSIRLNMYLLQIRLDIFKMSLEVFPSTSTSTFNWIKTEPLLLLLVCLQLRKPPPH